jgi:photosystem II stability/assembly factor-like uncharacterized protein
MRACLSHGGRTTYTADQPARELLVGTRDGVFAVTRSGVGNAWSVGRRGLEGHHVSALMVAPQTDTIFAGTHEGGVLASDDGGRHWQPRSAGLMSDDIYCLTYAADNGSARIYAGTEPARLGFSDDAGASWNELPALRSVPSVEKWTFPGPPHIAHVKNITFDPRSSRTIYAGIEVGGLLKSTDGGESWREMHGVYEDVHRVVIRPSRPDEVLVTGGDGLYRSPDGGETWQQVTTRADRIAYPDGFVVHPGDDRLMFMSGAIASPGTWRKTHFADPRVARSRDGGRSWEILDKGFPEHLRGNFEALTIHVYPQGFSLFLGTTDGDIYCSDDGGDSWYLAASGLPAVSKGGHYQPLRAPDSGELAAAH